ncbi:TetR/AcrR family transcriptional regulator [Amycolatopsis albispora]|uniref:TetR family transcriptional regulator n=1 Tax=Amycolatopsis albispora TaxID=1804986 RepID=A0A344LD67_9PSEU|nr:TetR/AcrR family transcriptional regulator [Amycolatopsis albispora]AXB45991.1 TetR family transcriptional regulator [Amycolatopsis albispora]
MATTELTPAAERVLEVAGKLFYAKGIHAVGVDLIAGEAGVTKKTLYDRFGSKDALIGHYLRRRDKRWRAHVHAVVGDAGDTAPADGLLLVFDALDSWMRTMNPRGCAFVNAHAELPDGDHPGRRVIAAQKRWLRDYLRDLAERAGLPEPAKLAGALLILLEGATVAGSLDVVPGAVGSAKQIAAGLIGAQQNR